MKHFNHNNKTNSSLNKVVVLINTNIKQITFYTPNTKTPNIKTPNTKDNT